MLDPEPFTLRSPPVTASPTPGNPRAGDDVQHRPSNAPTSAAGPARALLARVFSLLALAGLAAGLHGFGRAGYLALTDAWIAPLQLSPNSREVVTLRMQMTKEQETRARLENELVSTDAEISAIASSIERLRRLESSYSEAMRWSSKSHDGQLGALAQEKAILERQQAMLGAETARNQEVLARAERNVDAGLITATDLEQARANLARSEVMLSEKALEHARVRSALAETSRAAVALFGAAGKPGAFGRAIGNASPEVIRFDELQINIELSVARLESERRAAQTRRAAAESGLRSADELKSELEATPPFQATQRELDLAFVPYSQLNGVHIGDRVITCRWFLVDCRDAGSVKQVYPGEVATEDPWGSPARGRYVELSLSDRSVIGQRTLRVRRADAAGAASGQTP